MIKKKHKDINNQLHKTFVLAKNLKVYRYELPRSICIFFSLLFFASCYNYHVEIIGLTDGIKDGTVFLKNSSGETLKAVNFVNAGFKIETRINELPGYCSLTLSSPGKKDIHTELYLEHGNYFVKYVKNNLGNYPIIKSNSTTQNELTAFHKLFECMSDTAYKKLRVLDDKYQDALKSKFWDDSVTALANRTETERAKLKDVGRLALEVYLKEHIRTPISLHVLQLLDFESDPVAFLNLFQKLPAEKRASDDGRAVYARLTALVHLIPGQLAPHIYGVMPNGKPIDLRSMHKKLILIEFWRAGNIESRKNHQIMIKKTWPVFQNDQLGIVSISFDTKRDWWLGSIRDDKLTWAQISDLKGDDSPNAVNWAITLMPDYFLLDGSGHILEKELQFSEIDISVEKYLKSKK